VRAIRGQLDEPEFFVALDDARAQVKNAAISSSFAAFSEWDRRSSTMGDRS
jgi:hypothetical protein